MLISWYYIGLNSMCLTSIYLLVKASPLGNLINAHPHSLHLWIWKQIHSGKFLNGSCNNFCIFFLAASMMNRQFI